MLEYLTARPIHFSAPTDSPCLLHDIAAKVWAQLGPREVPVRFAVTQSDDRIWHCETGVLVGSSTPESIFHFAKRSYEDSTTFNSVMIVPTGIGGRHWGACWRRKPRSYSHCKCLRLIDYSPKRSQRIGHHPDSRQRFLR